MLTRKLSLAVLIGVFLGTGVFADDFIDMNTAFDGDLLNTRIGKYVTNVSNLIPDSPTLQNVWSYVPTGRGWFGFGLNASLAFYDQKDVAKIAGNASEFTTTRDLAEFPESIPFLPGVAIDLRAGTGRFDVGIVGMWIDENTLAEYIGGFLGEGNHFYYRMLGADVRYVLIKDGQRNFGISSPFWPDVTLQGGYYFTWVGFGISAGSTENVNAQFRNDTVFFSAQVSKNLPLLTPYIGMKLLFSTTDSEYDWQTERPVKVTYKGKLELYPDGAQFLAATKQGETLAYFQFYGGVGINILPILPITVGAAYNVVTKHFAVNVAVRMVL